MPWSRRTFLASSSASFLTTVAPGVRAAFSADANSERDILIVLFLRFGADGLTLVPPADDGDYHANRPTLGVSASAALPIGSLDGVPFFFHPTLADMKALYDAKSLAVVHAAGLETESRSHFLSQDKMERGVADGERAQSGGWLGRHLVARTLALPGLGAITSATAVDLALQGYPGAIAVVPDLTRFDVEGAPQNMDVIEAMHSGTEPLVVTGRATIDTIRTVRQRLATLPQPAGNPYGYTDGELSRSLRSVATIIKAGIGMEVATVGQGAWDHHTNLLRFFGSNATELSRSLAAFWTEMADYRSRITLVAMTEFGRRVKENANAGLDHGSASVMFVLGGNVNGGRLYGEWPGLKPADLHAGDLKVSTDYRQVLQEILVKRRAESTPQAVFPTLEYRPLGILNGDDTSIRPATRKQPRIGAYYW